MKSIIGFIIGIISIILSLYIGIWIMLVGGIVEVINGISTINAMAIAIGIIKILFCEISGVISIIGISLGMIIANS